MRRSARTRWPHPPRVPPSSPHGPGYCGPVTATPAADARVVLYTRAGCHLCVPAREVVAAEAERAGAGWREVDIDADPVLVARHGEFVPVVEVDGARVAYWRVDAARLRAALQHQ